jgi:halimadienyl-diphosphate synthase
MASTAYDTAWAARLGEIEPELSNRSLAWLVENQLPDGSWGTYLPTAEETAYALQALWVWDQKAGRVPRGALLNGARWLKENLDLPYPPLWIGKCLYSPRLVIRSAIVSALALLR